MKKNSLVVSILFLVITLTSSLKIAGTIGYYAFFTEDFVERFCENKERPELNCDGKCALAKMLLQESSDDTPPINLDLLKTETLLFLESGMAIYFPINLENTTPISDYTNHYRFNFTDQEIQPPRV